MADEVNDILSQHGFSPAATSAPPAGIGHAMMRGLASTAADVDQLGANIAGIVGKIPGTPNINAFSKYAARRAQNIRQSLDSDTAVPQTTGEKLAERTTSAVTGAIPYMMSDGPIGAGVVGALQNSDKGPWGATKAGVKAALFAKAAGVAGKTATQVLDKTALDVVPAFVKRGVGGASVGAGLGYVASGGDPMEALAQAGAGGILGATQRPPATREGSLTAATGKVSAKERGMADRYQAALPALDETVRQTGVQPKTIGDHYKNVSATMGRLEDEYQQYMAPVAQQQVWGTPIADAIRQTITPVEVSGKVEEAEELGKIKEARAKQFEKQFTIEELDNLRQLYFENLRGDSREALAARSNADKAADRAAEEAIKGIVYPAVDQVAQGSGKPAGYVQDGIKKIQAMLYPIQDALLIRVPELKDADAVIQATPWRQRSNITLALHPSGNVVGSQHGLMKQIFGDPESTASINRQVQSAYSTKSKQSRIAALAASQAAKPDRTAKPPVNDGSQYLDLLQVPQ